VNRHLSSFIARPSNAHVLAWAVVCFVFPLIWMGGFVTTYKAGMAVPDWPTTYGYNMFLYPLESWLNVWDVFLEHSHRLVASSVGMLTIALAAVLWLGDPRRSIRWLGLLALLGVCLQGVLGGLRVVADERLLAKIHGCTAPVIFALAASLVVFTSHACRECLPPVSRSGRRAGGESSLPKISAVVTAAIYLQIVAGAQLRHLVPQEQTFWFAVWVWIHLIMAGLAAGGVAWIAVRTGASTGESPIVIRRACLLAVLMLLQLILGAATWVTNYGWPVWFTHYVWTLEYTVVAGGPWQAVLTTAHVAVASLVLVTALSLTLWSSRLPVTGNDRMQGLAEQTPQ